MSIRLTRLETLPEAMLEDQIWLFDIAVANRMNQTDMLEEINRRTAQHGIKPVSLSALNRYVMRVRNGEIGRPTPPSAKTSPDLGILSPEFRSRLVLSIGEAAVRAQEAALAALVKP